MIALAACGQGTPATSPLPAPHPVSPAPVTAGPSRPSPPAMVARPATPPPPARTELHVVGRIHSDDVTPPVRLHAGVFDARDELAGRDFASDDHGNYEVWLHLPAGAEHVTVFATMKPPPSDCSDWWNTYVGADIPASGSELRMDDMEPWPDCCPE